MFIKKQLEYKVINTPTGIGAFVCYNKKESKSLTMENKPIATRTMYCKSCAEKRYPFSGQVFAVFGGTSQKIHLMKADHNQKKGMTPHFIYLVKKDKHFVTIQALCAIHNCGVEIIINKETDLHDLFLFKDRMKNIELPIKDYLHFITKWRGWTGYNI